MLGERVTIGTSALDEEREFVLEIGQAMIKLNGEEGSVSFDAEAFLSRIHLEDPKFFVVD